MAPKQAAQKAGQAAAAASAPPPAAEAELEELFEKLDRFIKNDQHKKALKAAEDSESRSRAVRAPLQGRRTRAAADVCGKISP